MNAAGGSRGEADVLVLRRSPGAPGYHSLGYVNINAG
jgi:hypothetical protein